MADFQEHVKSHITSKRATTELSQETDNDGVVNIATSKNVLSFTMSNSYPFNASIIPAEAAKSLSTLITFIKEDHQH